MRKSIRFSLLLLTFVIFIFFGCRKEEPIHFQENERAELLKGLNEYYLSVGYEAIEEKDLADMTHVEIDGQRKSNYREIKFLPVFYKLSSLSLKNLKFSHVSSNDLGNLEKISLGELVIENCDMKDEQLRLFINKGNRIFRVSIFDAPNITDESLKLLLDLKEVDEIYVANTGISQEGMGKLSAKFGAKLKEPGHVLGE
ncbi:hypothetical protein AB3N59_04145 [Leptospira sp. WS92.C1]